MERIDLFMHSPDHVEAVHVDEVGDGEDPLLWRFVREQCQAESLYPLNDHLVLPLQLLEVFALQLGEMVFDLPCVVLMSLANVPASLSSSRFSRSRAC